MLLVARCDALIEEYLDGTWAFRGRAGGSETSLNHDDGAGAMGDPGIGTVDAQGASG